MSETATDIMNDNINALNSNEIIIGRNSDSGVHLQDVENNICEKSDLIDINNSDVNLLNNSAFINPDFSSEFNSECAMMNVQTKDEEFHDAVQFFRDPSSLNFLENVGASDTATEPSSIRSSLYINFDPLHAKFNSQAVKSNGLGEISEAVAPGVSDSTNESEPVINKHLLNASPKKSLSNILISFDSPVVNGNSIPESEGETNTLPFNEPPKHYSENEFQQALKSQELIVQEAYLKTQRELEQRILDMETKLQENEAKTKEQNLLCVAFSEILKELGDAAFSLSDEKKRLQESYENEICKLKEDLRTSMEDLQSVESTFSDFHKRYEQCKDMLKVYTQNEDNLKQQLENLNIKLKEKDEMYKALQSRTEEIVDKANIEVANAKKSGEAQIAVLKAQLKKAELKIASLESDVIHIKSENGQLSSVIDELMLKVSEG